MKALQLSILSLFLLMFPVVQAQDIIEDYSFFRSNTITVIHSDTLAMPWTGGINSIRFSEIDLNGDGLNDLFGFEKHGNRILTFIQQNGHYCYAPAYAKHFPDLHDWVILKDYNHDGKPDIFTYGLAGIRVFKNVSSNSTLAFELVTDQLLAYYYNGYVNVYASPDDYLVVEDVDGDGRMDILNFWVLGKYVHFLRNYSDDPEQFDLHLENECWGHFEEAADNNTITLFSDCASKQTGDEALRHTGSTMLLHDINNDGLKDLLIGDIDSPNLILLYNHGTNEDARMTEQDTLFPSAAPIQLYSMPAPLMITLPGATTPSLIASPADPSLTKSQDLNSVWRYEYDSLLQQYTLQSTAFLQEQMIDVGSGCLPVFYDWNGDGLTDLFLANYGSFDSASVNNGFVTSYFSSSISYYENIGTSSDPVFQLRDNDFGHLKSGNYQALYPAFKDLDLDGNVDMLCGRKDGTLIMVPYSRLTTGEGEIIENYHDIDVGAYSTPQWFDLDKDGRKDLLIGNQRGLISFYRNIGICGGTDLEFITDTLGQVDVRDYEQSYFGYSVPCFFRDAQNRTVLFCGSESGNIHYYNQIDENIYGSFQHAYIWESADNNCHYCSRKLKEGRRTGVAVANLNGDAYPDLFVGNYAGGVTAFEGRSATIHGNGIQNNEGDDCQVYPNPTTNIIHIKQNGSILNLKLYDALGHLLLQTTNSSIDLHHYAPGLYLLDVNGHKHKIIKQD